MPALLSALDTHLLQEITSMFEIVPTGVNQVEVDVQSLVASGT